MCYICEAKGTVGKNYKAAQKMIAEAQRVWPRCDRASSKFLPMPSKSTRLWEVDSLRAYAKARS